MPDYISLSPLGFGCAPVMGKVSKADSLRAMAAAFDTGVTHFDVARSYGFGRAESVLGEFVRGRRDRVTITTKFGVVPPNLNLKTKLLIPVARQATRLFPNLKTRLKRKSGQLLADRNFDVSYARKCLDTSLRELNTDYIDIYLVHEPDHASSVSDIELQRFMDEAVKAGKIRCWGYALQSPSHFEWAANLGGFITQFEGNFSTLQSVGGILDSDVQRIVTRPFMGGGHANAEFEAGIERTGVCPSLTDMGATLADVSLCMARILSGKTGTVLCSMFSEHHIHQNVRSFTRFENDSQMASVVTALINSYSVSQVAKQPA